MAGEFGHVPLSIGFRKTFEIARAGLSGWLSLQSLSRSQPKIVVRN